MSVGSRSQLPGCCYHLQLPWAVTGSARKPNSNCVHCGETWRSQSPARRCSLPHCCFRCSCSIPSGPSDPQGSSGVPDDSRRRHAEHVEAHRSNTVPSHQSLHTGPAVARGREQQDAVRAAWASSVGRRFLLGDGSSRHPGLQEAFAGCCYWLNSNCRPAGLS